MRKKAVSQQKEIGKRLNIGASVDEYLWRRLRALSIKEGKLSGQLLDEAIKIYLERKGERLD